LLVEKTVVKEVMDRALHSVSGLTNMKEEIAKIQLGKLVESIQQLQVRVEELELQEVSSTL
jgi:hypothetical protein